MRVRVTVVFIFIMLGGDCFTVFSAHLNVYFWVLLRRGMMEHVIRHLRLVAWEDTWTWRLPMVLTTLKAVHTAIFLSKSDNASNIILLNYTTRCFFSRFASTQHDWVTHLGAMASVRWRCLYFRPIDNALFSRLDFMCDDCRRLWLLDLYTGKNLTSLHLVLVRIENARDCLL